MKNLVLVILISFFCGRIIADDQASASTMPSSQLPSIIVINNTNKNVNLWIEKKGHGALKQWIAVTPGENSLDLKMVGFDNLGPNDKFIVQEAQVVGEGKPASGKKLVGTLPSLNASEITTKKFVVESCQSNGNCTVTLSDISARQ